MISITFLRGCTTLQLIGMSSFSCCQRAHKSCIRFVLVAVTLLTIQCGSIKTEHDYDMMADFSKYHTYSFSERSLQYNNTNSGARFLNKIDMEMAKRGITKSDKADVTFDVYLKKKKKEASMVTTSDATNPWATGYGVGFDATNTINKTYDDAAIFVSLLDQRNKRMIWQARSTGVIPENASEAKRNKAIDKIINQMFDKFPFRYK